MDPNVSLKYDVFLSFRGEGTRKNFTDNLYHALERSGLIVTFKDDGKPEAGEEIASELLEAIQQSWCSVIIFSENYAFSGWCLEELTEIVKQKEKQGLKIFPIFYDVDPSDLRRQKGKVEEAFAQHAKRYKEDTIQKWRNALTQVASLSGWNLNDKYESEFIGDIVKKLSAAKFCQTYPIVDGGLVGISSRLEELYSKIQTGEDDVRIIGICGMGGIGKTTLAEVAYGKLSPDFESKSFIYHVGTFSDKRRLVPLQKQLLSEILNEESFHFSTVEEGITVIRHRLPQRKVLVVLDDVDNLQQLECLAGSRDWFGLGSRIIVTTRDEHLLRSHGVDDVYKPTTLNVDDAHRLFNLKAFGNDTMPNDDFKELSKHVVGCAGGLPLALEFFGSFLCGRDEAQWKRAIEGLQRDSSKEIIGVLHSFNIFIQELERVIFYSLRISFDGLEETEKNIFLDIACFFEGEEKDFVIKVLDEFSDIGIDVLVAKSLVTVDEDNRLRMHGLLKEMGRNIVRQKSIEEPGRRCRLWDERDVHHVLTQNTATEVIEGMVIDYKRESNDILNLSADAFSKMKNLRLLKVLCVLKCNHLDYLSNELRVLAWNRCPLTSLPSSFQPHNLVALILPYSRIEQLWEGIVPMYKLNLINLKGSQNLIETPDFTEAPNLEILILEDCTRLVDVHPSIGVLRRLKVLNLKGCNSLRNLPTKIRMESLEKLTLSGCHNIENLQEMLGQAEILSSLTELDLSYCNLEEEDFPSDICWPSALKILNLSGNHFTRIPLSLTQLSGLYDLDLSYCKELKSLPGPLTTIERLRCVFLAENINMAEQMSDNVESSCSPRLQFQDPQLASIGPHHKFSRLSSLDLSNCKELKSLPGLPTTIEMTKQMSDKAAINKPRLLRSSSYPSVSPCIFRTPFPRLQFQDPQLASIGPHHKFSRLSSLYLSNCKELKSLPGLPTTIEMTKQMSDKAAINKPRLLRSSSSPSVSPCIFRTPFPRLQFQDPQLASIGPYHKTKDLPLEKYKYEFLHRFLSRTKKQGKDLRFYVEKMMSLECRTRECYSEDLSMSSSEFVEMMLLDGCFIMEALAYFAQDGASKDWVFPIQPWQLPILVRDLLILENQIPFFVLEMLFESLKESQSQEETPTLSLPTMALKIFDLAFHRSIDISCEFDHLKPDHLLDLFLHSIYPSSPIHSHRTTMVLPNFVHSFLKKINARNQSSVSTVDQQNDRQLPFYLTRNVKELQASGIELRPRIAARFTDIDFNNGVLKIPSVSIDDLFIAILNNGVAFEHCSNRSSKDLSAYVSFMSKLIRHPTDAELLSSNGIISSFSHDDEIVFDSFSILGMNISDLVLPQSYLSDRLKDLECYYTRYERTRPWQRLVSRYWNVSFFCVANLLFGFIPLKLIVSSMISIDQQVKFNDMCADLWLSSVALYLLNVILIVTLLYYNRHAVNIQEPSDVANAGESPSHVVVNAGESPPDPLTSGGRSSLRNIKKRGVLTPEELN